MRTVLICSIAAAMLVACATPNAQPRHSSLAPDIPPRPNIILILFDDLGFSDLGAYGGEIPTPAIDTLAVNGLSVLQAYNHAKCSPTRAALLTGAYPQRAGIQNAVSRKGQPRAPGPNQGWLTHDIPTIAETLSAAGYGTYMSGKWHVGEDKGNWPTDRGFERYWGLISGASSFFEIIDEPRERTFAEDGEEWTPPADGFYVTTETGDRAEGYIRDHVVTRGDSPFFLYVSFTAPHWPLHALEPDVDALQGVFDTGWDALATERTLRLRDGAMAGAGVAPSSRPTTSPAWTEVEDKADWIRRMQVYGAMMVSADREVADIVAVLEETGRLDNTLILIASDNGASPEDPETERGLHDPQVPIGQRGSYVGYNEPWAWLSNTPFRDFKKSLYEGGVRTPFIVHWPDGLVSSGRVDRDSWLTLTDIPATAYALAGAEADPQDGISFVPVLRGEIQPRPEPYFWEFSGGRAVRDGDWKAVRPAGGDWELYDLATDPTEDVDLAGVEPDRLKRLIDQWTDWAKTVGARQ